MTHGQGMLKHLALDGSGILNPLFHANIHFLPKTGHTAHTRWMGLNERLLHLFGIRVHNNLCAFGDTKETPPALKDMSEREETHDAVVFSDRKILVIGYHGSIILSMSQDDAFGIARSATRIENVRNIIVAGLSIERLHLTLARTALSQLQELVKKDTARIISSLAY